MDRSIHEAYDFDGYLHALGDDWYADDALLGCWLARAGVPAEPLALVERFGREVAGPLREAADRAERVECRPRLEERDPYNRRSARILLPGVTVRAQGQVHGSGLWSAGLDERARYAIAYLLNQNGEAGVLCSVACTDGLARALRELGSDARSRAVLDRLERATPEDWIHGAQFVTEIQGGSDAATNVLRAEPTAEGLYALDGQKWFCSNPTADYWLMTARVGGEPGDHRGVGLFCVPREHEGVANGWEILRLKDKLGTRALPTAEIEFRGTLGWPVGPLDRGLRNMVAIVLTTSRVHNVLAVAGMARRAAREAHAYARFRSAFGRRLEEHALLAASLERIAERADRLEAGALGTVDTWLAALVRPDDEGLRLWARVLVSVAKAVTTRAGPSHVYEAMMVFGGNGVEERFCALPRLWRDAAILETWEGPYTLLLMQALGDLVRYGAAGREEELLRLGLGDQLDPADAKTLSQILLTPDDPAQILRWGDLAPRLYHSFEQRTLADLRR